MTCADHRLSDLDRRAFIRRCCGSFEIRGPLEGASAIRVINAGESRWPRDGANPAYPGAG